MNFFVNLLQKLNPIGGSIILLIILVFCFSFVVNIVIKLKYMKIQDDLDNKQQRRTGIFNNDLLNRIVDDYKNTAIDNYSEVNTQAIIEKIFNLSHRGLILGEKFVTHTISILITLGLLGTFLGLTLSVGELVNLFDLAQDSTLLDNFASIADGLLFALSGMAVAFITSIFGIGCSIILTVVFIVINAQETRENLMINIEEYLDNTVAIVVAKDKETEYTLINKILKQTFTEFGHTIERTLKETVEAYGEKLSHVVLDVELSSKTLEGTVDKFDSSLKSFASNIRDFTEFNVNLKNNIERMDVNFIKVTDAMKNTSDALSQNFKSIEDFSGSIRASGEEMTKYNRQAVKDTQDLVSEVKSSVLTIKDLSEILDKSMEIRSKEITIYQEKFNMIISRLTDEIDHLGSKAAEAFSQSLDENSTILVKKVISGMEESLNGLFTLLDSYSENEKTLAKTITLLPDQSLTYNEAATSRIENQVLEMKKLLEGIKIPEDK